MLDPFPQLLTYVIWFNNMQSPKESLQFAGFMMFKHDAYLCPPIPCSSGRANLREDIKKGASIKLILLK